MAIVKSQSAMEYLMTYGWAILIIAVVLGALFQLGVFSGIGTPKAQPGNCQVVKVGSGITQTISLAGQCQGQEPEYVAKFNNGNTILISSPSENDGFPNGYTMTAWVDYTSPVNVCGYALGIEDSSSQPRGGLVLSCNNQAQPYGETINQGGTSHAAPSSKQTVAFGQWAFIAVSWDPSAQTISFYLNGKIVGSPVTDTILPANMIMENTPYYVIGGQTSGGGYNGYEADAQMYNTSLSSDELLALYNEGIGGAPIDPQYIVGWWPLNGNAKDYSGNNNNGQTYGGVTFSSSWTSGYTAP